MESTQRTNNRGTVQIDATSVKGIFGWARIDGVDVPYILRNKTTKFVSVRMVEKKLLSNYPSTYPEELKNRPPLTSQYITAHEARLLNDINSQHCGFEFGTHLFTGQDLIVVLSDFEEFYRIVKKNFPDKSGVSLAAEAPPIHVDGGWVQINNTIVPFIVRNSIKLVPLPVIKYGANLLNNVQVTGIESRDAEIDFLNHNCQKISLDFTFTKETTKLIEISLIPTLSETKVAITQLPKEDPFSHAHYKTEEEIEQPSPNYPSAMQKFPPTRNNYPKPRHIPQPHGKPPVPAPVATVSRPPPAMQWMGPHMGIFQHHPGHAPPPYMPPMNPRVPPPVTNPIGPGRVSPKDVPQKLISGNALDLSAKTSPPPPAHQHTRANTNANAASKKRVTDIPKTRLKGTQKPSAPTKRVKMVTLSNGETIQLLSTSFHGKGITCIIKQGEGYALLESLNRMFFPKCPLSKFMHELQNSFKLEIQELTDEEEQAFIAHYELQIKRLRCNRVINLEALDLHMTQMKMVLNETVSTPPVVPPAEGATNQSEVGEGSNHRAACQALKDFIGKRIESADAGQMSGSEASPPPAKKPRSSKHGTGKLENIMNKLKKAQLKADESMETSSEGGDLRETNSPFDSSASEVTDAANNNDIPSDLSHSKDDIQDLSRSNDNIHSVAADRSMDEQEMDAVDKSNPDSVELSKSINSPISEMPVITQETKCISTDKNENECKMDVSDLDDNEQSADTGDDAGQVEGNDVTENDSTEPKKECCGETEMTQAVNSGEDVSKDLPEDKEELKEDSSPSQDPVGCSENVVTASCSKSDDLPLETEQCNHEHSLNEDSNVESVEAVSENKDCDVTNETASKTNDATEEAGEKDNVEDNNNQSSAPNDGDIENEVQGQSPNGNCSSETPDVDISAIHDSLVESTEVIAKINEMIDQIESKSENRPAGKISEDIDR